MAPFVSPKTWFNKRGGSGISGGGSKKKKTTLSTTTSSSLTMTSYPVNNNTSMPHYHTNADKEPFYYTTVPSSTTTTPATVDTALAQKHLAFSSSPISPFGTNMSGTTTLVNGTAMLSPTSSTGGHGIGSMSLPHLPYNPALSSPEKHYIPQTTYKPNPTRLRSGSASEDAPAHHKAQKQYADQSTHHQQPQVPSKPFMSQPIPFPAGDSQQQPQPIVQCELANLSTTGETAKGSARARWYLNRARINRNKSTQNLNQMQDQQHQKPQQPEKVLERQSSRGTFKGMAARFRPSSENIRALETVAQEYARTIKALWQMVEEEELSQRLADATPEEREWIILHHSNLSETSTLASCYYIPNQLINANPSRDQFRFSRESTSSEGSRNSCCAPAAAPAPAPATSSGTSSRCNSRCNSRLSFVEPTYNYNKNHYTHHTQADHHQFQAPPLSPIRESHNVHGSPSSTKPSSLETTPFHPQPTKMGGRSTFQESCRVHPDPKSSPVSKDSDPEAFFNNDDGQYSFQRRGTKVSDLAKQSAMELQKRDNFTLQQRIDMEEDWRLQAKLLQGNVEAAVRIQHSHQHHNSFCAVHHHTKFPEYEPPENDYDDKEELNEDDPRLMSGIVSAAAALAAAQEVDPEKVAVYEEAAIRARGRRAYDDIEKELELLGQLRYEMGIDSQLGESAFSDSEYVSSSSFSEGVADPEDPETVLGVAHKVGVFGVRRESRLMYHARDASRQSQIIEVV